MAALALATVVRLDGELGVALSANQLFTFVGAREGSEGGLDLDAAQSAATKSEDQVEGRLLLDVVVRESAAVFELLAGEDKALLVGRDAFLVLDLGSEKGCRGRELLT